MKRTESGGSLTVPVDRLLDADTVKAFIWNGMNVARPLCNHKVKVWDNGGWADI